MALEYKKTFNVDTFKFWSGAVQTVEAARKAGKMDELQEFIEEYFARNDGEIPTATEINDLVWLGGSEVLNALGIGQL